MTDYGENQDQGQAWNEASGRSWVRQDAEMTKRLSSINKLLLDNLGKVDGQRILDIGCGSGTTTIALAELVGQNGNVTGLDISAPLLELARQKAGANQLIDFIQADAQSHQFTAPYYDLVISRFGVMFFENPLKAFTNIRGAMRQNGRLSFVCWAPFQENEFFTLPLQIVQTHTKQMFDNPGKEPGPFAFSDADYLDDVLNKAGFQRISIAKKSVEISNDGSPEEDADLMMEIGFGGRALRSAEPDDATIKAVRDDFIAQSQAHFDGSKISYDGTIYLVNAFA